MYPVERGRSADQSPFVSGDQSIHGHITHNPETRVDRLYVEIQQFGTEAMPQKVPVSADGSFEFDGTPGASYMVRLTTLEGNVITQTLATPSGLGYVEIRLPEQNDTRPITGTVSAFELSHKVPPKALKEAREADKRLQKHDLDGYISHTEKAAKIDPDFVAARRNLGIVYLRSGQYEKAIEEFQAVLAKDSHSLVSYNGLAAASLQLQNYVESESAARRALNLDPSSEVGHYVLGVSLDMQNKKESEALEHLDKVSKQMPKAHLVAADILEKSGKMTEMKSQLQAYLASGDQEARSAVKSWLSSLK